MDISIDADFNCGAVIEMLFFSKLDYIVTTLTPRPEDQELDSIDQTLQDTFSVRSSHTVPIPFAHLLCIFLSINLFSVFHHLLMEVYNKYI